MPQFSKHLSLPNRFAVFVIGFSLGGCIGELHDVEYQQTDFAGYDSGQKEVTVRTSTHTARALDDGYVLLRSRSLLPTAECTRISLTSGESIGTSACDSGPVSAPLPAIGRYELRWSQTLRNWEVLDRSTSSTIAVPQELTSQYSLLIIADWDDQPAFVVSSFIHGSGLSLVKLDGSVITASDPIPPDRELVHVYLTDDHTLGVIIMQQYGTFRPLPILSGFSPFVSPDYFTPANQDVLVWDIATGQIQQITD